MVINLDSERFQSALESVGGRLIIISCENHAAYIKPDFGENVYQADNVNVIGDSEVAAYLVFFYIIGIDNDNYFSFIFKLQKHLKLAVGLESRKNPRSVIVVEKLAAEFKIKLVAELRNTSPNVF